jgi:hypothetical protein
MMAFYAGLAPTFPLADRRVSFRGDVFVCGSQLEEPADDRAGGRGDDRDDHRGGTASAD